MGVYVRDRNGARRASMNAATPLKEQDSSIIALDKFIQATCDSGYKGTPSAISEPVHTTPGTTVRWKHSIRRPIRPRTLWHGTSERVAQSGQARNRLHLASRKHPEVG